MKLNRHERKIIQFAYRAGYLDAHADIQGGGVPVGIKPGDTPEAAARLFAENVTRHADAGAFRFADEVAERGLPS